MSWGDDYLALRITTQRLAKALIDIVGQRWVGPQCNCCRKICPTCFTGDTHGGAHEEHCPWIIAARALGIA